MTRASADRLLLLGPLEVIRDGRPLAQPPSRKVRALLAYLAIAGRPVSRERLCELLWDVADDPRGELRWCLSKLRPLIDRATTKRLSADRENVWIDPATLGVDALAVASSAPDALSRGTPNDLRLLLASFRGEFLEGLTLERAPLFDNWAEGQRHRFGQLRQQLLERLVALLPPECDDRLEALRECLDVAPFDEAVHIELVRALLGRGLHAEADRQIAASVTRFEIEGIDPSSLRSAFAAVQQSTSNSVRMSLVGTPRLDVAPDRRGPQTRGPTLLLLPFTAAPENLADADSVTSDIIFGIARLRSISVIARGTAFCLRNRTPAAAASIVNAQYVASGHLRRDGRKYIVTVELVDPISGRIIWVDEFSCNAADSFSVPPVLAARIITGLDAEIRIIERNRALLMPPASLDAWQAYHRGLTCVQHFTTDSNREAQHFFNRAIALDPTFSRSYAALSFTHFQNAFHLHVREAEREIASAFRTANQAMEADPSDPAAHCAIGRALWLQHAHPGAVDQITQSIRLSPNFAFAHYSLAFVQAHTGDPVCSIDAADAAVQLSPLDPMMFGTHRVRTFALLRLGRVEEAADRAELVGRYAGDHFHAHAVAALTLAAAGRLDKARAARQRIIELRPDYNFKLFKEALRTLDDLTEIYRKAAKLLEIPEC